MLNNLAMPQNSDLSHMEVTTFQASTFEVLETTDLSEREREREQLKENSNQFWTIALFKWLKAVGRKKNKKFCYSPAEKTVLAAYDGLVI